MTNIDDNTERVRAALIIGEILLAASPSCGNNLKECMKNIFPNASDAEASAHEEEKPPHKPQPQKTKGGISRRNFLRILGGGITAPAMLSETASVLFKKNMKPPGYGRRNNNPLGTFLYDSIDYRDVSAAEGLERIAKSLHGRGTIVVIYGDAHRASIRHYAISPRARKLKQTAYLPFRKVAPSELKTFAYDKNRWKKIQSESL